MKLRRLREEWSVEELPEDSEPGSKEGTDQRMSSRAPGRAATRQLKTLTAFTV